MRAFLIQAGLRGWTIHPLGLPGNPDFLFADAKIAVFVDGCYWHGCPKCGHAITKNRAYWNAKIQGNKARDRLTNRRLREFGFQDVRVWEHELADSCKRSWLNRLRNLLMSTFEVDDG